MEKYFEMGRERGDRDATETESVSPCDFDVLMGGFLDDFPDVHRDNVEEYG